MPFFGYQPKNPSLYQDQIFNLFTRGPQRRSSAVISVHRHRVVHSLENDLLSPLYLSIFTYSSELNLIVFEGTFYCTATYSEVLYMC